jgi:hypothetical protein
MWQIKTLICTECFFFLLLAINPVLIFHLCLGFSITDYFFFIDNFFLCQVFIDDYYIHIYVCVCFLSFSLMFFLYNKQTVACALNYYQKYDIEYSR